jgi:hypothetical protein
MSTDQIARNQEFWPLDPSHWRPKSKGKVVALQNVYMVVLFDQGHKLSKEVWVNQEWKPKQWSRAHRFF